MKDWFDVCFIPHTLTTSYLGATPKMKFSISTRSLRGSSVREDSNLRRYLTNSKGLQERINPRESPEVDASPMQHEPTFFETTPGASQSQKTEEHKVLGVLWNPESDQFIFDVTDLARAAPELHPTKRNLVSVIGKFYDPLGFLSPVIIWFKILLQKLCQCKLGLNKVIPEELIQKWNGLISDRSEAQPVSFSRSYLYNITESLTSITICGFCCSSTKAFAAVVYLLLRTEDHSVVRFVAAKTRVEPLQSQNYPSPGVAVCLPSVKDCCLYTQ